MKQFCFLYFSFKNALKKLIFTDFDTETVENYRSNFEEKEGTNVSFFTKGSIFFLRARIFWPVCRGLFLQSRELSCIELAPVSNCSFTTFPAKWFSLCCRLWA
jgi:hypothetical protein